MSTYSWPTGRAFKPASITWGQRRLERASVSSLNGSMQSLELPGSRWSVVLDFPAQVVADRRQLEAYILRLNGRQHRIQMARPGITAPAGSINTSGVTASAAVQFASALTLNGCGANKTLLAGDMVGVTTSAGQQLIEVPADATANGSGVMSIECRPMLRAAVASGAAVTLLQPTALFVLADPANLDWPREAGGICPGVTIELVEVFA